MEWTVCLMYATNQCNSTYHTSIHPCRGCEAMKATHIANLKADIGKKNRSLTDIRMKLLVIATAVLWTELPLTVVSQRVSKLSWVTSIPGTPKVSGTVQEVSRESLESVG